MNTNRGLCVCVCPVRKPCDGPMSHLRNPNKRTKVS